MKHTITSSKARWVRVSTLLKPNGLYETRGGSLPAVSITKINMEIVVRGKGGPLGKLCLNKTKIQWLPSPNSKKGKILSWDNFAVLMEDEKIGKAGTIKTKRSIMVKKVNRKVAKAVGAKKEKLGIS